MAYALEKAIASISNYMDKYDKNGNWHKSALQQVSFILFWDTADENGFNHCVPNPEYESNIFPGEDAESVEMTLAGYDVWPMHWERIHIHMEDD